MLERGGETGSRLLEQIQWLRQIRNFRMWGSITRICNAAVWPKPICNAISVNGQKGDYIVH